SPWSGPACSARGARLSSRRGAGGAACTPAEQPAARAGLTPTGPARAAVTLQPCPTPPPRGMSERAMRTALGAFGECVGTDGGVVVLFLAYLLWGSARQASQHQPAFAGQLQREWGAHRGARPVAVTLHLVTGKPFAFIRIPRFGAEWRFAIV